MDRDLIDRLRDIPDPVERWRAASDEQARAQQDLLDLAPVRTEIVIQLQSRGLSLREIGDMLGVSKTRVAQVAEQRWS